MMVDQSTGRLYRRGGLSRRHLLRAGALGGAGALAIAAVGCGKSGSAGGKPQTSAASSPAKPVAGGTFTMNVNNDPFDWDLSYVGKTLPNSNGTAMAYESLLTDARGPNVAYGDLTIKPLLAQSWESPDAQSYTFKLRPNVKFADIPPVNGRVVNSADVKWSYEYWSRTGDPKLAALPKAQFDWFFAGIDRIETPDATTAVVRFTQPFAPFVNYAASDFNPIVPHEIFDQYGNLHEHIAGTGPWQLDQSSSQRGNKWVWKRNPSYWQSGRPYVNEVDWLVLPDTSTAIAALTSHQLDWLGNGVLSCQQASTTKQTNGSAHQFSYQNPAWEIYMQVQKPPLNDERVRQAIGYAINRDEFISSLDCNNGGWGLAGAFPTTFTQAEIKQIVHHDPQQAKQLLSATGLSSGVSIDFIYPGNSYGDIYISEMQLLQAQLKKIGINLSLQTLDKADFSKDKKTYNFSMTIQGKGDLLGDVDDYLFGTFYSKSKANYGQVKDPHLDQLILQQRHEVDASKRMQRIKEAITYLNQHALGLAIQQGSAYEFTSARVQNYAPQFGMHMMPTVDTWLRA